MPTTTKAALPYPASTDSPNGPLQFQNLALALDPMVVPRFTTLAARNAAFPAPVQGDTCTVAGLQHVHDGVAWRWARRALTNGTTDTGGNLIIPHSLGATPTAVLVCSGTQANDTLNRTVSVNVTNKDANNFVAYVKRTDTSAALASTQVEIVWEAFV